MVVDSFPTIRTVFKNRLARFSVVAEMRCIQKLLDRVLFCAFCGSVQFVRMPSLRRRMCATAKGNAEGRIVPCGC
jgi:hypothetical protein